MNRIVKRGSLRFLSFSTACLMAFSSVTGAAGNYLSVNAVSHTDEYRTWKQSDPRWGDLHLGKSGYNMRGSGCAATALAFLVAKAGNFTDTDFDPGVFCRLMTQFNGFGSEGDIYWAKVSSVAPGFRYEKTEYLKKDTPYEERYEAIKKYIDEGKYVIIDVQNSGHWVAVDCIENDRIISFDSGGNRDTDVFKQYDHRGNTCIKVFRSDYVTQVLPEPEYNFYTGKYITTSDNLNIRKTPSSQSEREGVLVKGMKVDVRGISGCWGMIIYNDVPAWICLEYAELYTGSDDENELPVTVNSGYGETQITGTVPSPAVVSEVPAEVTSVKKAETTAETISVITGALTAETKASAVMTTSIKASETVETTSENVTVTTVPVTTAVTETLVSESDYSDFSKVKCRTTSALNFRKGPGTENSIICVIPDGTLVEINGVSEDDRWGTIEYKGQKGWICLDYVAPEDDKVTEKPSAETAEKAKETTAVITSALTAETTTSEVMTTTVTTSETAVITTSENVTATTVPVTTAVTETTVSESEYSDFGKVKCRTTSALNFRKGPGTENSIICVIPNGTLVEINGVSEDDRWGTIEYKGQKGWICLDYAVPEDEEVTDEPSVTGIPAPETTEPKETVPPATEEQKPATTEPKETVPPATEEQKPVTTEPKETVSPVTEEKKPVTAKSNETAPPAADETEPASDTMPSGQILGSAVYNLTVIKPEPDESGILRGDVDKNGFINVLDYIMLKKHFDGRSETGMSEEADVNSDGSVTLNDLMMLRGVFRSGK